MKLFTLMLPFLSLFSCRAFIQRLTLRSQMGSAFRVFSYNDWKSWWSLILWWFLLSSVISLDKLMISFSYGIDFIPFAEFNFTYSYHFISTCAWRFTVIHVCSYILLRSNKTANPWFSPERFSLLTEIYSLQRFCPKGTFLAVWVLSPHKKFPRQPKWSLWDVKNLQEEKKSLWREKISVKRENLSWENHWFAVLFWPRQYVY